MALLTFNFESQYLNNNHEISIILPDKPREVEPAAFYGSGKKYKVLWLLHGTFGDHSDWIRKSNIELYACEKGPHRRHAQRPERQLRQLGSASPSATTCTTTSSKELMPLIYGWFPASDKREDNFIAGLSMGGNGTLQYAAGHPEKFGGAAILSCAPRDLHQLAKDLEDPEFAKVNYRLVNGIRNAGGMEGYLNSPINVWDRLPELIEQDALPPLYFCCGKNDFLYDRYKAFKEYAQKLGLKATFEEFDGFTHEWRFWDLTIQKALTFFGLDPEEALGNPF